LNPDNTELSEIGHPIYAFSTDMEKATDYGSRIFARKVFSEIIRRKRDDSRFPTGLIAFGMHLFCSKRYLLLRERRGRNGEEYFSVRPTTRGWLMGDYFTKVILTVAGEYLSLKAMMSSWRICGDDHISLGKYREGHRFILAAESIDMKISMLDTFISRVIMYYAEECALVPQGVLDTLRIQINRNRGSELGYIDYPRIRLLLPIKLESDAYSYTTTGRMELLGKEARWVVASGGDQALFHRAQLIQRLSVPTEGKILCPFTPKDIGGDGGFTKKTAFLLRVIVRRAGCYGIISDTRRLELIGEISYRILSLYEQDWAHKYVCSHRLLAGTTRRDAFSPIIDKLKEFIPEEHRIVPRDDLEEVILSSMKHLVQTPGETFFNILKSLYYREIFRGRDPPEIPRGGPPDMSLRGRTDPVILFNRVRQILSQFLRMWVNPGFTYKDKNKFFVRTTFTVDSLTVQAGEEDIRQLDVNGRELYLNSLLHFLREEGTLPAWMSARLGQYFESDILVKHKIHQKISQLREAGKTFAMIIIITRDLRLCAEARRLLDAAHIWGLVMALDPMMYLSGRLGEVEGVFPETTIVEDQGAMTWCDRHYFRDGVPEFDIWEAPWSWRPTRYERVLVARMETSRLYPIEDTHPWMR
jgi:hypothetical protein